jgi:hypothetical protein
MRKDHQKWDGDPFWWSFYARQIPIEISNWGAIVGTERRSKLKDVGKDSVKEAGILLPMRFGRTRFLMRVPGQQKQIGLAVTHGQVKCCPANADCALGRVDVIGLFVAGATEKSDGS